MRHSGQPSTQPMTQAAAQQRVVFGAEPLSIEQVIALAQGKAEAALSDNIHWQEMIQSGADFLDELLTEDGVIYGVTTGYGDSCTVAIPADMVHELPEHLFSFHGCGMGNVLDVESARAVLAVRLCSLARGFSGVSLALLQRLVWLLNENIIPVIPEEGSVGASGDLTPLSYVAAVLSGERDVFWNGERVSSKAVYQALNIQPLTLRPKEGLAIMNGTAVMTALACIAFKRAEQVSRAATCVTSMNILALGGNPYHYDEVLFAQKPHSGQQQVAAWIREDIAAEKLQAHQSERLQDRYSLRCAPHVIGIFEDSKQWLRQFIENELNSSNDNPLIDPIGKRVLHGGHFYGGHIAQAMDSLKLIIANIADLLDRQLAQLVDNKFNHGLPRNLTGASPERLPLNHGFKAVQIAVSAWTAEALKLTMPASVFSRSTECHNQDKVSMGTIAARDALRILQLVEQVLAATLIAGKQAMALRELQQASEPVQYGQQIQATLDWLAQDFEFLQEDRALECCLRSLVARLQQGELLAAYHA
jgi:histidine ammonia-lyase